MMELMVRLQELDFAYNRLKMQSQTYMQKDSIQLVELNNLLDKIDENIQNLRMFITRN